MRSKNSLIDHLTLAAGYTCVGASPCSINSVVSRILLVVFLLFSTLWTLPPEAAPAISWNFESPEQYRGWEGEGIEAGMIQGGVFRILGKEEFQLVLPPGLNIPAERNPYLRIRLRFQSPRYMRVFWQSRGGKPILSLRVIQPPFDRHFHTYWIPLAKSPEQKGKVERVGLFFGGRPGWIEIDSLDIGPFSLKEYVLSQWQEFCLPRPLNLATINFLQSPWLFNKPFASWLNIIAALIIILGAIFYFTAGDKKKIKIVSSIGFTMLVLWIIYDIRETYSQYQMVEEVYRSYVRPPPGEKTFPALGDFYGFIDLCREKIPQDSQYHFYPYPDWPYDCRIHYFLYPRRITSATWVNVIEGDDIPYHVVYRNPGVRHDAASGRLRRGDSYISRPGRIVGLFDEDSFIFLEDR